MPVRIERLKEEITNNHIAMKGSTTWSMAAAALKERKGQSSWPLVVLKSDGSFSAATFDEIFASGEVAPEAVLETILALQPVETIDADSMTTKEVNDKATSTGKLYVITANGKYKYAVNGRKRGGGDLPSGKLSELAGKTADLSKLGDFLLDE